MSEATISSKSRNLSVGWTNSVKQQYNKQGRGYLTVKTPTAPREQGGLRTCEAEFQHACTINSGNYWNSALFVGGKRVIAIWDTLYFITTHDYDEQMDNARLSGKYPHLGSKQTWMLTTTEELLERLREGETLRVKLADE